MDTLSDAELAQSLQFQFDSENTNNGESQSAATTQTGRRRSGPMGIVDERWELIDPHPDIRALFLQYNDKFFWGRLDGIEVKWSPRMTLCAGLCCYEGYGGLCSVKLSQPLLKLRPRKDLVETLLHEMIHAYLFITQNNKDHDGHGPEFCKHMNRINSETGTKISIYHTFHDEVDLYRQHWWRCDGPCRQRKPYFGYVKRSMNRVPSSNDTWWGEHQRSCGGTYTKVKEPEGYGQKKKGGKKKTTTDENSSDPGGTEDKPVKGSMDIRNFVAFSGKGQSLGESSSKGGKTSNSGPSATSKQTNPNASSTNPLLNATSKQSNAESASSAKPNVSAIFGKTGKPSEPPRLPSMAGKGTSSSSVDTVVSNVTRRSGSVSNVGSDGSRSGTSKKPRFTPVVATAGGRVISSGNSQYTSTNSSAGHKDSVAESPPKTKRKFIPVVSAVGRKVIEPAVKALPGSSTSHKDVQSSSRMSQHDSSAVQLSSKTSQHSSDRVGGDRNVSIHKELSNSSGKQGSKKRARLVDLQTVFDSDSDDESSSHRSSKLPRCSTDDDTVMVPDRTSTGTSNTSDKENSIIAIDERTDDITDDISIIERGSANGTASFAGNRITSGIWKDLSHLSSSGNRRSPKIGRVAPPLFGKSGGKKSSRDRNNSNGTLPRSSFCEHPWQTAAREAGAKETRAGSSVNRIGGGVVIVASDDEEDVHSNRPVSQAQPGPKTVPCPVCNLQIEEKKINGHLDTCLTYNSDALFS